MVVGSKNTRLLGCKETRRECVDHSWLKGIAHPPKIEIVSLLTAASRKSLESFKREMRVWSDHIFLIKVVNCSPKNLFKGQTFWKKYTHKLIKKKKKSIIIKFYLCVCTCINLTPLTLSVSHIFRIGWLIVSRSGGQVQCHDTLNSPVIKPRNLSMLRDPSSDPLGEENRGRKESR